MGVLHLSLRIHLSQRTFQESVLSFHPMFKGSNSCLHVPKSSVFTYWATSPDLIPLLLKNVYLISFSQLYCIMHLNEISPVAGSNLVTSGFEWSRWQQRNFPEVESVQLAKATGKTEIQQDHMQFYSNLPEHLHMPLSLPNFYICARSFWLSHLREVSGFYSTASLHTYIKNLTPWQIYMTVLFRGMMLSLFTDVIVMN